MNPTNTTAQPQNVPFTESHNQVYNNLRNILMQYHSQGIPGMQKIIDGLNKQHTDLMQTYTPPQRPQEPSRPAAPLAPAALQSASDLMGQIRSATGAQLPNGYSSYAQ